MDLGQNERTPEMTLLDEVQRAKSLPKPAVARLIRIEAGVTQDRFARELGVHRMTIVRWEAGTRRPRGATRARYADLLMQLRREVEGA
jgi:DNA-binding transcriptional regulator YiaG